MKVACEACGARYAIPDEKIRGATRSFKVTCRQCEAIIMVQGIAGTDDPVWHFAIGRERRGPADLETLRSHVEAGDLTEESLVWRQGMAGWEPLVSVPDLAGVLSGDLPAEALVEDVEPQVDDDTTIVARSELHAAHAALSAEGGESPEAASSGSSLLDGLFDTDEPLADSTPVHERHDTSVLFSLDDLAASKEKLPGVTLPNADDASGLIDVLAVKDRSGNRRRPMTQSPFDDGPAPVKRRTQEGPSIAVPVIKRRTNYAPMILGAVVLLAGGAFAFMQMQKSAETAPSTEAKPPVAKPVAPAPPEKTVTAAAQPTKAQAAKAPEPKAQPAKAPEPKADATSSADAESKPMTAAERRRQRRIERREKAKQEREARREGRSSENKDRPATTKPEPKKVAAPTPPPKAAAPTPPPKAADQPPKKDVNALLAALNKNDKGGGAGGASGGAANLPAKLSPSKLRGTLRKKRSKFGACYKKMTDPPAGGITVNTSLVVAGSGSVKSVRITSGGGASSAVLRCISSVLKGTKFPPFSSNKMPVNYPIVLR